MVPSAQRIQAGQRPEDTSQTRASNRGQHKTPQYRIEEQEREVLNEVVNALGGRV